VTVLRSGSATDVGKVRKVNQDLPLEATNLYAVADGMGGHVGGEVAAQVAVDALQQGFTREPTRTGLERAFTAANQAVWQESQEHSELRGMGTTLTAVALVGGDDGRDILALANVGDSRAYLFSEGQLVQVTADHSLAEERVRHGEMTEQEAAVHPQRHILTRALGISLDVEADMWELRLRSGDRLVLCSDGLSNELSTEEIASVLATVPDPGDTARRLVELANEHGGSDNITVIVVDVLVGEDAHPDGSVIAPVGARAGSPLIVTHGSPPGPDGAAPATDVLAKGAQLGFAGSMGTLSGDEPTSGEFFLDNTRAVPVARATVRSVVTPATEPAPAPPDESRRERRRRLGVQRRITVRVILFILLVAAIPVGAFFAIRWYAYDNWFLSVQHNEIVIQQGHPGGVLWFHPRVVDRTGVHTSKLPSSGVSEIRSGVQEPSLAAAKSYVSNLQSEYADSLKAGKSTSTSTSTSGVGGTPGAASSVPPANASTTTTVGTTVPSTTAP